MNVTLRLSSCLYPSAARCCDPRSAVRPALGVTTSPSVAMMCGSKQRAVQRRTASSLASIASSTPPSSAAAGFIVSGARRSRAQQLWRAGASGARESTRRRKGSRRHSRTRRRTRVWTPGGDTAADRARLWRASRPAFFGGPRCVAFRRDLSTVVCATTMTWRAPTSPPSAPMAALSLAGRLPLLRGARAAPPRRCAAVPQLPLRRAPARPPRRAHAAPHASVGGPLLQLAASSAPKAAASALAAAPLVFNGANTAWVMVCTVLVLFMNLPGLQLFYGGMVNSKNMVSVFLTCTAVQCICTLVWFAVGYRCARARRISARKPRR